MRLISTLFTSNIDDNNKSQTHFKTGINIYFQYVFFKTLFTKLTCKDLIQVSLVAQIVRGLAQFLVYYGSATGDSNSRQFQINFSFEAA